MLNGSKARIAVLVSGGGTNLQALLDAQQRGEIHSGEIVLVISNNPDAYALTRAANAGVPSAVLTKKDCGGQASFEEKLTELLDGAGIDLVILAGFMSILSADFTARWPERIINVHPSLIPSFCGTGAYGLHVHEMALARGVKVTGATVHFVDEGTDSGPIILQKAVEIKEGDTPEVLQRRVMEEAEWKLLPKAIDLFANGKITVDGRVTHIAE